MKNHDDSREDLELNDSERMGYICHVSNQTVDMFSRQEGRLQRSFYQALHELQRLRKERLALVLPIPTIVANKEDNPDPQDIPSIIESVEPSPTPPIEQPAA
jgi:hypothetical protein